MQPGEKRNFGRVDIEVTAFAFGTAPIGNIFKPIDEETSGGMIQKPGDTGRRRTDSRCTTTAAADPTAT